MIIYLVRYLGKYYIRSLKYIFPVFLFLCIVGILYSQNNINIWSNYSFTVNIVFLFSIWITYTFIDVEDEIQQQLTVLKVSNKLSYFVSQIITLFIINSIFSCYLILHPIIFKIFNRDIMFNELIIIILFHILSIFMGITFACMFSPRIIKDKGTIIGSLILFGLVSVLINIIIEKIEFLFFIKYILPPISYISSIMINMDKEEFSILLNKLPLAIVYSLLYITAYTFIYIKLSYLKMFNKEYKT